MKTSTAKRLIALNLEFYDSFARQFSESRNKAQPGITRALTLLDGGERFLDAGCGDGRVLRYLGERAIDQRPKSYVGVEQSAEFLRCCEEGAEGSPIDAVAWLQADLCTESWSQRIDQGGHGFDRVVCFSVLHHIPSEGLRQHVLFELQRSMSPGGLLCLSVWQVSHVPRLKAKILPWSTAGFTPEELEPGDLLMDWKRGGVGLRYVHELDEPELVSLCDKAGLIVEESYRSDGATGDMGLYVVARKP